MQRIEGIFFRDISLKGRGVFTSVFIQKGSLIELCPVLIIPKEQTDIIHHSVLHDYYFLWDNGCFALALGFGSLYNHSFSPNTEYVMDFNDNLIKIQAIRDINPGEELTFNYNGDSEDRAPVWFKVRQ